MANTPKSKTSKVVNQVREIKQPIAGNGLPIHKMSVPGIHRSAGTPGWVSGPAKSAAKKAK